MRSLASLSIAALVMSTAFAAAPALAIDPSISRLCGPDAPEGYKRPGGYCDLIGANDSASSGSDKSAGSGLANDGPEDQ